MDEMPDFATSDPALLPPSPHPSPNAIIKTMSARSDLLGTGLKIHTGLLPYHCCHFLLRPLSVALRRLLVASCHKSPVSEGERRSGLHVLDGEGGGGGGVWWPMSVPGAASHS